jgi:hypothetical protein
VRQLWLEPAELQAWKNVSKYSRTCIVRQMTIFMVHESGAVAVRELHVPRLFFDVADILRLLLNVNFYDSLGALLELGNSEFSAPIALQQRVNTKD